MGQNSSSLATSAAQGAAGGCTCCCARSNAESTGYTPRRISPRDKQQSLAGVLQGQSSAASIKELESAAAQLPPGLEVASIPTPTRSQHAGELRLGARDGQGSASPAENEPEGEATPNEPEAPSEHPSVGSALHSEGGCKRCCFFSKGRCHNGPACEFCHYPHEKRKRNKHRKRNHSEANAAVLGAAALEPVLESTRDSADCSGAESCPDEPGPVAAAGGAALEPEGGCSHEEPDCSGRPAEETGEAQPPSCLPASVGSASEQGVDHRAAAAPALACQGERGPRAGLRGGLEPYYGGMGHRAEEAPAPACRGELDDPRAGLRGGPEPYYGGGAGADMPVYVDGSTLSPAVSGFPRDWQQPAFVHHSDVSQWVTLSTFSPQDDTMYRYGGMQPTHAAWETHGGYDPGLLCWSASEPYALDAVAAGEAQQFHAGMQGLAPATACTSGARPVLLRGVPAEQLPICPR